MKKIEKQTIVTNIHEKLKIANLIILTEYRGLNVAQITKLRQDFSHIKSEYKIIKNTLLKLASRGTQLEPIQESFEGPLALVICYDDPVQATRVLKNFAKNQPLLKIRGGVMEGEVLTPAYIYELSSLPSRDILVKMLLGTMFYPVRGLVNAISEPMKKLVLVLDAIRFKKEKSL